MSVYNRTIHNPTTKSHIMKKKSVKTVRSFMEEQTAHLYQCGRIGTAKNYERALNSFMAFTLNDIPLSAVSERLIGDYNAFLQRRGVVRNTVSFYMRILRAVYNKAVREGLVTQTSPFQNVYTGIDRTPKRAVDEMVIAELSGLKLPDGDPKDLARDLFIFSYGTRGMSFVDTVYLKRTDIHGDVIRYSRRKTGQSLSVRVEPRIGEIISKYECRNSKEPKDECGPEFPYLFPVITSLDPKESYRQYRSAINTYNRRLRELSDMLPTGCCLTSYTARHSWASTARKHNAPVAVISAGLGHTSEKTTQIYLTAIEDSAIDTVNRCLLDDLFRE